MLLTEEEEILNNNLLNPPPIMASKDADTLMVDTRGIKTASIQDKVVNLLHNDKDNNTIKNILCVLYRQAKIQKIQ